MVQEGAPDGKLPVFSWLREVVKLRRDEPAGKLRSGCLDVDAALLETEDPVPGEEGVHLERGQFSHGTGVGVDAHVVERLNEHLSADEH